METKANYTVIGVFTLAVIAAVFGFIYWFQSIGGPGGRAYYSVVFDGSVSGLRTGGAVLFNGIRVGEVTGLKLNPAKSKQVIATVAVEKSVVIRADTEIGLEFQGLTGIASIALSGGSPDKPAVAGAASKDGAVPVLNAPPGATQDVTQAAREALRRLDNFVAENQTALHSAIVNIDTFSKALADNGKRIDAAIADLNKFSGTLAQNSERVDHVMTGLETLIGGEDGKSGQINLAAISLKTMLDNVDKRTAEIANGVNQVTKTATRQLDAVGTDARKTLAIIDRTFTNLDRNPSRLIFGGGNAASGR